MTVRITDQRLQDFLEALPRADANSLCSPPGLGGVWRVKHIRSGLTRNVLTVHHSGAIIAFQRYTSKHGACAACVAQRSICEHCNCSTCIWEREADEHGGSHVTPEAVQRLIAKLQTFQFAAKPNVELDA